MSTELQQSAHFVNPTTGEALTLASPTDDLGRFLADVRDVESQLREAKRIVTREILARFDRKATWTERFDGLKLTGDSPAPVEEWDGAELREALLKLVDEGVVTIEAVDHAVNTIITYKPRKAGISALRKLGGRVADTINQLAHTEERERRVSVSRG